MKSSITYSLLDAQMNTSTNTHTQKLHWQQLTRGHETINVCIIHGRFRFHLAHICLSRNYISYISMPITKVCFYSNYLGNLYMSGHEIRHTLITLLLHEYLDNYMKWIICDSSNELFLGKLIYCPSVIRLGHVLKKLVTLNTWLSDLGCVCQQIIF